MGDLQNNFPLWGESGSYPPAGFFYEGGDQVNEKHMDALWNGIENHISTINISIKERVRDFQDNIVIQDGLSASAGGTREVDVTSSPLGAYVDGERTGSISAQTTTHSTNGTGSTRTDVVYVDDDGNVDKSEGTASVPNNELKIAEVDIDTNDSITAIREYTKYHNFHRASETDPPSPNPGDLWHDESSDRIHVRQSLAWNALVTEQDDLTVSANDGLSTGGTVDLIGGATIDLSLDESAIKDGGVKEVDAAEFAGDSGSSGQVLQTDGTSTSWETVIAQFAQEANISGLNEGELAYAEDTNSLFVEDGL